MDLKTKNHDYIRTNENAAKIKSSYNKTLLSIGLLLVIIGLSNAQIIQFICAVLISISILVFARDMLITEYCIGQFNRLVRKEDSPFMYKFEVICAYGLAAWSLFLGIKCVF